jgi:hypothetical protein
VTGSSDLVLRPSWKKFGRGILLRFTPLLVAYVAFQFLLAAQIGGKDSVWELLPLGAIAVVIAGDAMYRMFSVVRVTPDRVEVGPPILRRVVSRHRVKGVALRSVSSYFGARVYAVVYGDGGRSIATLPEQTWEEADLRHLGNVLAGHTGPSRTVTADELRTEFPGALVVSRYLGWTLAFVVVVLIFLGVALQGR